MSYNTLLYNQIECSFNRIFTRIVRFGHQKIQRFYFCTMSPIDYSIVHWVSRMFVYLIN